ncbi:MAG: MarR family transcriptional regulator [Brachybacterium sp.]|uniref:MarR family transcriptional regulator n=1 Tax=Brachybacterium sp. TaxID=1891286 RepID=UPI0026536B3F|nr:MarR family transcriptional regulator [Brachybacterium sp.]MDN6329637.1 MarR family transcriptional regulator [Brachybacterium sp.]MDN6401070.1 MarR family transcriptional regulator [Brachybacterium sp.]
MFVLSLSGRPGHGRTVSDPVPALLEALADLELPLPAERTVGPEALVLAGRAEEALEVLLRAAEVGGLAVGLGVGAVERPLPASVREIAGPASAAAEEAVRAAAATSQVPLVVRAADSRHQDTAADVEAVLQLVGWMIRARSRGQWEAVRALRHDPAATQAQLAERLSVTQQTVSRAVKTSGWREESAAHPLAVRLLSMIDLTSAR